MVTTAPERQPTARWPGIRDRYPRWPAPGAEPGAVRMGADRQFLAPAWHAGSTERAPAPRYRRRRCSRSPRFGERTWSSPYLRRR